MMLLQVCRCFAPVRREDKRRPAQGNEPPPLQAAAPAQGYAHAEEARAGPTLQLLIIAGYFFLRPTAEAPMTAPATTEQPAQPAPAERPDQPAPTN